MRVYFITKLKIQFFLDSIICFVCPVQVKGYILALNYFLAIRQLMEVQRIESVCSCVCVCVRERERHREKEIVREVERFTVCPKLCTKYGWETL